MRAALRAIPDGSYTTSKICSMTTALAARRSGSRSSIRIAGDEAESTSPAAILRPRAR